MALRRDVYKSEGPVDIPLSRCRQAGANGGFPALGEAGRRCSQTFLSEGDEGKRNASRHHAGCICGLASCRSGVEDCGGDPQTSACPFVQVSQYGIEQDHRRVKQRIGPMLGFKRFDSAAVTISGIELAAKIRKEQFKVGKLPDRPTTVPAIWTAVVAA